MSVLKKPFQGWSKELLRARDDDDDDYNFASGMRRGAELYRNDAWRRHKERYKNGRLRRSTENQVVLKRSTTEEYVREKMEFDMRADAFTFATED